MKSTIFLFALVAVVTLTSGAPADIAAKRAASTVNYNRVSATDYARKHCKNHNNGQYPYIDDNDCTNFASQVLHAGGIPMSDAWYCKPSSWRDTCWLGVRINGYSCEDDYKFPPQWAVVDDLYNYLICNKLARECVAAAAKAGDLIQYHNPSDGWHHTAVILNSVNGNFQIAYHTNDVCDGWDNVVLAANNNDKHRFICIN
jgi:hypothetical protein